MIQILIPMAGRGSRFADVGYSLPKPLITVHSQPMVKVVIDNLKPKAEHRFIFICLKDHVGKYRIDRLLKSAEPESEIILLDEVTEGAACTVLKAKHLINNDDQLMIANSDQWIDFDINLYCEQMNRSGDDGLIMTMSASDPKWSFVEMKNGYVARVVEKEVISNEATVGIYNFARGSDFVEAAESMIRQNKRVNGEFYVAPAYNEIINKGGKIGIYNIGSDFEGMYGLGTPQDLNKFLVHPKSEKYK